MSPKMSSNLVGYTHDFLTEFIQLYKSFPCLWQVRCIGYKDRLLRNRAYDILVKKLKEVNESADRETVIRKINTLRTAFRREYKKVRSSQKTVKNPKLRYKSSLWYYDLLKFVAEQNEDGSCCKPEIDVTKDEETSSNQDAGCQEEMTIQSEVGKTEPLSPAPTRVATPISGFQPVILDTEGCYGGRHSAPIIGDTKRKREQENCQEEHGKPADTNYDVTKRSVASSTDDDFETFGRYVACKLRKSTIKQSIIAERLIADVLLRANLATLDETTSLSDKSSSRCFLVMDDH